MWARGFVGGQNKWWRFEVVEVKTHGWGADWDTDNLKRKK
jgi:hypothetical protein